MNATRISAGRAAGVAARPAARPELSRVAVVDRALDLADAEGLDAVTVRRLAQDFGVTPMALYWHVKNKEELLAAMGERFFDGIVAAADSAVSRAGKDWTDQFRAVLAVLVDALRRHPSAVYLAGQQVLRCPGGLDLAERVLGILAAAGFSTAAGADLAHKSMLMSMALVDGQSGGGSESERAEHQVQLADKRAVLERLPVDKYPLVVTAAADLTDCADVDAYYSDGIELCVAGAQTLARR